MTTTDNKKGITHAKNTKKPKKKQTGGSFLAYSGIDGNQLTMICRIA
jgi:hypothetical protein